MSNNKIDWIVEGIKRTLPRGMRNNNPLNVKRFPNSSWIGMKAEQTDEEFLQFTDIVYGYRATLIIIARTYRKRGWNTVESILTHYAPSTENNTKAYIAAVVKELQTKLGYNFGKHTPLPQPNEVSMKVWVALMAAMQNVECGKGYVNESKMEQAFKLLFY